MLNITALLEEIKQTPYTDLNIYAPHTGILDYTNINEGDEVKASSGQWQEIPGTKIATITREKNSKPILATQKGLIQKLFKEQDRQFVEAGTQIAVLRHFLSKKEVVHILLQKALHLFIAPERAKYYFAPEIDKKVKISGHKSISVFDGMDLFIVSRMKREVPLAYHGPEGIIYELYFEQNQNVDADAPLIGVCSPDQLTTIEDVINRVHLEWDEQKLK